MVFLPIFYGDGGTKIFPCPLREGDEMLKIMYFKNL